MFQLPDFNIFCNIWRYQNPLPSAPDEPDVPCNLAFGRRVEVVHVWPIVNAATADVHRHFWSYAFTPLLLLPSGTNIWDGRDGPVPGLITNDLVEVPSGSGLYYIVMAVQDLGRGFVNEHRGALLLPLSEWMMVITGNPWNASSPPNPIP